MLKKVLISVLAVLLICIYSCVGQPAKKTEAETIKEKLDFYDKKYSSKIEAYRQLLYNKYYTKMKPNDYERLKNVSLDTCPIRYGYYVLKEYINFDSVLLKQVQLSEKVFFHKIVFNRRDDSTTIWGRVDPSLKSTVSVVNGFMTYVYWCNYLSDHCTVDERIEQKLKDDYEDHTLQVENGFFVVLYRHKMTNAEIIRFVIEPFYKNKAYPIQLDIFLELQTPPN
jgi:hypothetical protein